MDKFSWKDNIQAALSSCIQCIRPNSRGIALPDSDSDDYFTSYSASCDDYQQHDRIRRARPDELAGLLADVSDGEDERGEMLSLHSNFGIDGGSGKKKKKKQGRKSKSSKTVTLFGWYLFGRTLSEEREREDDDEFGRPVRTRTTSNSSTVDSDALALDPAVIASLSSPELRNRVLEVERDELRKKEARREVRRALKLSRKGNGGLEFDLNATRGMDDDFEGFQGSGTVYADGDEYTVSLDGGPTYTRHANADNDEDGEADLDAELYATRQTKAGRLSSGGSDSRSNSSANSHRYFTQRQPRQTAGMDLMKDSVMTASSATSQSIPSPVSANFSPHPITISTGGEELEPHEPFRIWGERGKDCQRGHGRVSR